MDFMEELCEDCGELIVELLDCPHTDPRCVLRNSIFAGIPFTHRVIVTPTEQISSVTEDLAKPKVKKPVKPGKSPKSTDDWDIDDLSELFQRRVNHRCQLTARKRLVPTSISTGTAAKRPPMRINSAENLLKLSSEVEARVKHFYVLFNQTIIALLQKDLANLPISSTATQENSVENQIESEGQVENNLDSATPSNDPAKTDSSDELNNQPSETPNDIDLEILKLADPIDKTLPYANLPKILDLMRSHMDNTRVLISCQQLINRYQSSLFNSKWFDSLMEILLSVLKQHCHDSEIVANFCDLLERTGVGRDRCQIDWFLKVIDILLDIGSGENNLTETAIKSTFQQLLNVIKSISKTDVNRRNSIGQKFMENISQSIRNELEKPKSAEIMLILCTCLRWICEKSAANQRKFLNSNGLSLIQECLKGQYNGRLRKNFTYSMSKLMEGLSYEDSIVPELMADGNPKILWQMWRDALSGKIRTFCRQIFTKFHSESPLIWPIAKPTVEEVGIQLKLSTGEGQSPTN